MSVVTDILTAGAPDQIAHLTVQTDMSAVKLQGIKQHIFITESSLCRQVLKQLANLGMDTNNLVQVRKKTQMLWLQKQQGRW